MSAYIDEICTNKVEINNTFGFDIKRSAEGCGDGEDIQY